MAEQMLQGNAVVGQSGGPTAVINASLVGVIEGLRPAVIEGHVERIYGARHAVSGMVNDDLVELQDVPGDRLERLAGTPSAALGSSRDKPDEAYCKKIVEVLRKRGVRYFFYIGGNDSSDTCRIVNEMAKQQAYELRAFHVPKTIDNDLVHNDHTPGFGSAAKFVAQAFMGDNLDNKALPGIKINIVMGRHAGFLTAASTLGRRHADDGPHLVYVPEVDLELDRFKRDVQRVYERHGRCLIAVSEGVHDAAGESITAKLAEEAGTVERDAHGNVQLSGTGALGDHLADSLKRYFADQGIKARIRADTFGYLQRSFAGCVSPTDQAEARHAGQVAVEHALAGERESGSVAIQRRNSPRYEPEYKLIRLTDVAAKTRTLEPKYIVGDNDIDPSFQDYAGPLVGDLPPTETLRQTGHG